MSLRSPAVLSLLAAFALLALSVSGVVAQSRTTSAIRGTVVQGNGAPVAFASVTLLQTETGAERRTATTPEGRFLLQLLQPGGPYVLTIEALGFAQIVREGIQLQVGETVTFEFTANEQAIDLEGIEVNASRAEIFTPDQVGPATRLDERTVEAVPILSRNIMELAVLSPLVKTTEGGGFSIAGQNDRYNSILIDGLLNKDLFGLTSGGVPGAQAGAKLIPLDAVAQYEVLVAPFDVRLSGFTGGVLNAITKNGTNEWHSRIFAVNRTEALIGDLNLPTGPVSASGVERNLFGGSVGGPILRDRLHFFVSGEFEERKQPPVGFNLGRDDPLLVRISPDAVSEVRSIFDSRWGAEAGDAGPYSLSLGLANVFGRLDWNFGNGSRLTLRNIFARARNDESPNRAAFEPYELSSNAVFREATNNTTTVQVFSPVGDRASNEFNLSIQRSTDGTSPAVDYPQVEIDVVSSIDGGGYQRPLRVGSQFFAQDNDLKQTTLRFTNSLNWSPARSNYTFGVTGAYHDIQHRYLPGALGDYYFASANDLANNAPQRYQRTLLLDGQSPDIGIRVTEWGAFVQNQIDSGKGLTMHFGLRADVPFVLDSPEENPEVLAEFGHSTANVPSGQILLSPRWGFNWQNEAARTTQVRGGAGMFVGQLPYVWLSNAFHNNGLRSVTAVCNGRVTDDPQPGSAVPSLDLGAPPITGCLRNPFQELRTVTVFEDGFKYPQDLKFSVGVDQELSDDVSASFGFLYNRAINQIALRELNLDSPSNTGPLDGYGNFERKYFGRQAPRGFVPNRELPGYEQVLLATNESDDWAFALTAEMRGNLTERLAFQTGYSFAKSYDRMSLVSADMISNYGFTPTNFNPNSPQIITSNFDRPHKVVLSIYGSPFPGLDDTQLSILYTGQSGLPFTYVYRGDLNGDGYPGLGPAFDRTNDAVYVPNEATEVPGSFAMWQLLGDALKNDACLRDNRGRIMERNACRAPWQNRLDLRLSHTLEAFGSELRFEGDLINVLNLLNRDWGNIDAINPVVSLLEPLGRAEGSGVLQSGWAGAVLPFRSEDGTLQASDPWSIVTPDSQWQAQFGIRLTFGGARYQR
jgi:hypothetical protein